MGPFGGESLLADASGPPFPWWILLDISVSVLVGTWLFSTTMVAWMMGLHALLARYPPVDEPVEESYFASGTLHWATLNRGLYVGLGSRGVHLAPTTVFRSPFYRGTPCIPWSELECVRSQHDEAIGWFRISRFKVAALGLRFSLRGEVGLVVERELLALSSGRP